LKEYGASFLLQHISQDIFKELKTNFREWKETFVFSVTRFYQCAPIKSVSFLYPTSCLSETVKYAHVSPDSLGDMLLRIGMDRQSMLHS
jgi:hypothetical protein